MVSNETSITNLLFRYAELIDAGDFEAIGELFAHAQLKILVSEGVFDTIDGRRIAQLFDEQIMRYPDGTPRTKHVITNPIVEVDDDAGTGTCRSYYTVYQRLDELPLQPIITGRYVDGFERVDGAWRFASRDYSLVDQVGDLSRHLRVNV